MNKKSKYNSTRNIILVTVAFSVLNLVLLLLNLDITFLFGASLPFYGAYIAIVYADIIWGIIALVSLIALVGCWFLCKDRILGLILAIGYFLIDILFLLWLVDFDIAIIAGELIFHVIIIGYLVYAIILFPKQKGAETEFLVEAEEKRNRTPIAPAEEVKARVFLEDDILGKHVIYRRVKPFNQLVIDGNVYDEYKAVVEFPHELKAEIDNHIYSAGIDKTSMMYLAIDGERVKIKRRLI